MDFISEDPAIQGQPADLRRHVRSHAARMAHRQERRRRVVDYQIHHARKHSRNRQESPQKDPTDDRVREGQPSQVATAGANPSNAQVVTVLGSATSFLDSGRLDPFSSFAVPLSLWEHFLLDHCEPRPSLNSESRQSGDIPHSCCLLGGAF